MQQSHQEYIKIVTNVGGNIDNLRRLEREKENLCLGAKLEHIKLSIDGTLRPF